MERVVGCFKAGGFPAPRAALGWHPLTQFTLSIIARSLFYQDPADQVTPRRALIGREALTWAYPDFLKLKNNRISSDGLSAIIVGLPRR